MKRVRLFALLVIGSVAACALWFGLGFVFTPEIDLRAHKPVGDKIWAKIVAFRTSTGHFPESEERLLGSGFLSSPERRMYLERYFGHRKFHYFIDDRMGPCLTLDHVPGVLSGVTVWRDRSVAEPGGPANGSQPLRPDPSREPGAAGSRR